MIDLQSIDVADLELMADLFEYPREGYVAAVVRAAREVGEPGARIHLAAFATEVAQMPPGLLEETHVRTFLVAPTSAPYVGVHLFGEESFKRAHLMSQLMGRFRAAGFDPGDELADHVAVLLRFARHLDSEELSDLVRWCLAVPIAAMHESIAESRNPYRHLLAALKAAVAPDGIPETVRAAIARAAQTPDPEGCSGCSVQHGGDEL